MRLILSVICVAGGMCGCVSHHSPIELMAVGPWTPAAQEPASVGSLVVYSALNTTPSPYDFEQLHHSDYEIRIANGQLVRRVANRLGLFGSDPATVELTPGRYTVIARASGRRRSVSVPVVIETAKSTFVHLDDSEPPGAKRAAAAQVVTFADGKAVGWRASAE